MKKALLIMAAAILGACAQDEPALEQEPDTNAPTTFSWLLEVDTDVALDAMSGYYDEDGKCILIAKHGNLIPFVETDTVTLDEYHSPISLFYSLGGQGTKLTATFVPEKGKHTTFFISSARLGEEGCTGIGIKEKTEYTWPQ
jgi:hypothetical protein